VVLGSVGKNFQVFPIDLDYMNEESSCVWSILPYEFCLSGAVSSRKYEGCGDFNSGFH